MSTQDAVEKILALRRLTEATGTKTTRAQNAILQSLQDSQLADVAVALARAEAALAVVVNSKRDEVNRNAYTTTK